MPWYAKDCHYLDDPKIIRLGDRFGAAGPLLIDRLMAKAKLLGKRGRVEYAFRSLASDAFAEGADQAREIVLAATELRILTDLDEDGFAFSAAFPEATWERWQRNFRQQQHRDRKRDEQREVTADNAPSREVTDRTGQDRTGQEPPNPPEGGAADPVAEVFTYWQQTLSKPDHKLTADRRRKVRARLDEGYTVADLKEAIDGIAGSPFHRGKNDQGREYLGLELICRNGSKVDEYRDMARAKVTPIRPSADGRDRSEYDAKVKVIGA